jgi:hypothetical protein
VTPKPLPFFAQKQTINVPTCAFKIHEMKRALSSLVLLSQIAVAQVGINTLTPRGALEIASNSNGGVLVPQFALTGSNDISTVVNPQGSNLVEGTLIYNTATVIGTNNISPGFLYWDGTKWESVNGGKDRVQIMFRRFTSSSIVTSGNFNFPQEIFNNINGASFASNTITLPKGIYSIESNIMTSNQFLIFWDVRLDGVVIDGVGGRTSNFNYSPNFSYSL